MSRLIKGAELAARVERDADGYLVDRETGERIVFYPCDPAKNAECKKTNCRALLPEGVGFCASTTEPEFRAEESRAFYKRLNAEGYFSREYIEEAST